jgi:hypothetical protein
MSLCAGRKRRATPPGWESSRWTSYKQATPLGWGVFPWDLDHARLLRFCFLTHPLQSVVLHVQPNTEARDSVRNSLDAAVRLKLNNQRLEVGGVTRGSFCAFGQEELLLHLSLWPLALVVAK